MTSSAPILELFPRSGEWTEADYFPHSDRGRLIELSDGELEVLPWPTDFHQLILLRLTSSLFGFVTANQLGQIRFAPLPVRLWAGKIREPDFLFMAAAHRDRIGSYWGVPDLVGEILSEGTEQHDRETKRTEYAQAGIPEYWIIDPFAKTVGRLRLTESRYEEAETLSVNDFLTSTQFPGWRFSVAELFAD